MKGQWTVKQRQRMAVKGLRKAVKAQGKGATWLTAMVSLLSRMRSMSGSPDRRPHGAISTEPTERGHRIEGRDRPAIPHESAESENLSDSQKIREHKCA